MRKFAILAALAFVSMAFSAHAETITWTKQQNFGTQFPQAVCGSENCHTKSAAAVAYICSRQARIDGKSCKNVTSIKFVKGCSGIRINTGNGQTYVAICGDDSTVRKYMKK